nr:ATP-binding protein [uncultured Catonella sp.]
MIQRKEFLNELIKWKNEKVIKIITGMRRAGKSTLLMQYQDYLRQSGVEENRIVSINFEELEYEELCDYRKLYNYIKDRLIEGKITYIFLDEIQKVKDFEKVIDSIYVKSGTDIYITGSNAYFLSGNLATYLTGRYVEILVLPFSFKEYKEVVNKDNEGAFSDYMKYGGLPFLTLMEKDIDKAYTYLEGIYNTVIVKDIEDRINLQITDNDKRKIYDISLLKLIAKYLASVVGSPVSVRGITNYIVSSGRKVSQNTVSDYVEALKEAFIFYEVSRFDIVGKQILSSNKKYYIVDLGLRNYILPRKNYDLGFSIENIVYFELLRRGYNINIGKQDKEEVDFIAVKNGIITYIQVTADMTAKETFEREIRPLNMIKDNYKKIILTLDKLTLGDYSGIKVKNLMEWLLEDSIKY